MMKVGLIGFGAIGNVHARAYKAMPDVQITAVADVEPERRQKAADMLSATPYANGTELIKNADVDMVDICLPTYLHAVHTIQALDNGKHVMCEKPMALNPAECDAMIAAEQRSGKTLMIGHCIRFWPEYHYLKSVNDSGVFGKLQLLSMSRIGSKTVNSWHDWQGDPALSGTQTVDRHIHDTDFILYLLGKPSEVRTLGHADQAGLSHVSTQYIYPNGPAVFAEGGGNIPPGYPFTMAYRAVFDKAVVEFLSTKKPTLLVYPWGDKPYEPEYQVEFDAEASTQTTGANITQLGAYWAEIRYLVDCIAEGRKPGIVTPQQAKTTLAVVQAEVESGLTGRSVSL